ncbi:MAG TPA: ABC transporter substrate-binding protein [Solirubrobacteraceae bacterium]
MSDDRFRDFAERLEAGLPQPPDGMDERVLAALAADARPRRAAWRRAWLRPVAAVAAAAVVLGLLAALPSSLDRIDSASAVPIAPLTATCPPKTENGAIEVAAVWNGSEARTFARVLGEFSRRTGVKVVYRYETRNIPAKLRARVRAGCPPDVALIPQPGLLYEFARQGAIKPLDAATAALVRRDYGPTWRQLASVDGRPYGVWFKASNKSLLWYRPDAVADPPATWDELGDVPLAVGGADGWTLTDLFENAYLQAAGRARYDALARHEIPWTDATVVRTLARLSRLFADPVAVGSREAMLGRTFEEAVRDALGRDATSAVFLEADFVRSFLGNGAADVAVAPFPQLRAGAPRAVVVGGDVAARFTSGRAAARLLRFLATPRAAAAWARAGGFTSPNRRVAPEVYPDALTRVAANHLARAEVVRFDLSDLQPPAFGATAGQGMWELFRSLAAGARPADVAAQLEAARRAAGAG